MTNPDIKIGKIIALDNNYALLEVKESEVCESCHSKSICTSGNEGMRTLRLENNLNVKVGDTVAYQTSSHGQLLVTAMQYGLPLIGFLSGIFSGYYLFDDSIFGMPKEIGEFLFGLIGLGIFGSITYLWSKKKSKTDFVLHRMVEIVNG